MKEQGQKAARNPSKQAKPDRRAEQADVFSQ